MRDFRTALWSLAVLILGGCGTAKFHAKCDSLALGSSYDYRMELEVDPRNLKALHRYLGRYLTRKEFTFETSTNTRYLSPPDSNGRQEIFTNIKTIGCSWRTFIWIDNVQSDKHVMITVNSTVFGDKSESLLYANDISSRITKLAKSPIKITRIAD
jgi:hypothetical protein